MGLKSLFSFVGCRYKTYDAVYSLGPNCACADYLRRLGLRTVAGPFDWLLADMPVRGLEILLGGFKDFMRPNDFIELPTEKKDIRRYYQNTKTGYLFMHDFSWKESFEEQFPSILEKYERRCNRLWEHLNSGKKILLVLYAERGGFITIEELKKWSDVLFSAFGKQVDCLCIQYNPHQTDEVRHIKISPQVDLYVLGTATTVRREEGNLQWDKARIKPILSKIHVRLTWRERLAKLYPAAVRVCAIFIWDKSKRDSFVESRLGK